MLLRTDRARLAASAALLAAWALCGCENRAGEYLAAEAGKDKRADGGVTYRPLGGSSDPDDLPSPPASGAARPGASPSRPGGSATPGSVQPAAGQPSAGQPASGPPQPGAGGGGSSNGSSNGSGGTGGATRPGSSPSSPGRPGATPPGGGATEGSRETEISSLEPGSYELEVLASAFRGGRRGAQFHLQAGQSLPAERIVAGRPHCVLTADRADGEVPKGSRSRVGSSEETYARPGATRITLVSEDALLRLECEKSDGARFKLKDIDGIASGLLTIVLSDQPHR